MHGGKVTVVGAGLVGRSWAIVFARAGWRVRLFDTVPSQLQAARLTMRIGLEQGAQHCGPEAIAEIEARIAFCENVDASLSGADWVQECLPEDLQAKLSCFADLDRRAPESAILASSTSSIIPSLFTETLRGRDRCLVAHPVNPPHLVPVVEICGAPWTAASALTRAREVMVSLGQKPIVLRREIEGFVINRLQGALLNEALRLVGEGFVSVADVDEAVRNGLGLRWSFMGPFETIELNAPGGIADYGRRYGGFYSKLAANPPGPLVWSQANLRTVVADRGPEPNLTERERLSRSRDRRLVALLKHKHQSKAR